MRTAKISACQFPIARGSFDDFRNNPNSVIVGSRLADTLQVSAGDAIQLLSPGGDYRRFTIAAVIPWAGLSIDERECHQAVIDRFCDAVSLIVAPVDRMPLTEQGKPNRAAIIRLARRSHAA